MATIRSLVADPLDLFGVFIQGGSVLAGATKLEAGTNFGLPASCRGKLQTFGTRQMGLVMAAACSG
jgi:hypothetical protein